jgi:hypothetical protein
VEISNKTLMKILKHQNEINQLVMHALENQPAVEELSIQPITVSKDSVPLPRLLDKIRNVIGVNILTANEIIEGMIMRFPELIENIKAKYKGCYANKEFINYDAHTKLKACIRNCLSNRDNFIITGVHNSHNNLRKKYANTTA